MGVRPVRGTRLTARRRRAGGAPQRSQLRSITRNGGECFEHDLVGSPVGPLHGPAAAQAFYDGLILVNEGMNPTREP
jgi:hypothetical protein